MTSYLEHTLPSDYDLDRGFCMTIGKAEYEWEARHIIKYCQEHGDKWQPVPADYVRKAAGVHIPKDEDFVEMPEGWLGLLQSVRVTLEGPPELIRNDKARGGLQLRFPNGRIWAAGHDFSTEEMAALSADLELRWFDAV